MQTYSILQLLTDEEVERMLAPTYEIVRIDDFAPAMLCAYDTQGVRSCPFSFAFVDQGPSPTPTAIARYLRDRTSRISEDEIWRRAGQFTNDNDQGKIRPEDLAEIVKLSREG